MTFTKILPRNTQKKRTNEKRKTLPHFVATLSFNVVSSLLPGVLCLIFAGLFARATRVNTRVGRRLSMAHSNLSPNKNALLYLKTIIIDGGLVMKGLMVIFWMPDNIFFFNLYPLLSKTNKWKKVSNNSV